MLSFCSVSCAVKVGSIVNDVACKSAEETLMCDHSNESYCIALKCGNDLLRLKKKKKKKKQA